MFPVCSGIIIFFDKMCSSPFCGLPLTEYDQKDAEADQPLVVTWEEAQGDLPHLPMNGPQVTCSVDVAVHADASFAMKLERMNCELDW